MWIQLLTEKTIETNGINTRYRKGDWIEVGKQTAHSWIQQGIAHLPNFDLTKEYIDFTAGIVIVGDTNFKLLDNIKQDVKGIDVEHSEVPVMAFSENLIWSNAAKIKRENIMVGFRLLKNWQIAVPLHSYDDLIIHQGLTTQEADYLTETLHDLRVPFYNTNLIFVNRCSQTQELFNQWQKEKEFVSNDQLAFHIAFYKTKVSLCALPVSWCD